MSAAPFTADASAAALLVVDLQNDFVREGAPQEVPDARATLPAVTALARCLSRGRRAGAVHAVHRGTASPPTTRGSRPSALRRRARAGRASPAGTATGPSLLEGHQIVDELTPLPGEVVVDKYGYGSFHNTLLEDALRAARATQVWVVGTVTQICVEETVREGFHRGFEMVVAADGVSSFDDELHQATLRNLGQKFALVERHRVADEDAGRRAAWRPPRR